MALLIEWPDTLNYLQVPATDEGNTEEKIDLIYPLKLGMTQPEQLKNEIWDRIITAFPLKTSSLTTLQSSHLM
jgi:hypothetical protein